MTELIVALDGPGKYTSIRDLAYALKDEAGIEWIKVGPQSLSHRFLPMSNRVSARFKIFLDLKLADTRDTVRKAVRRFEHAGIAAVSTFTHDATIAAMEVRGALQVWQIGRLSESTAAWNADRSCISTGIICPGEDACSWKAHWHEELTVVVPGVRLHDTDEFHGHHLGCKCEDIVGIADYAVVGRPIWSAAAPVSVALEYKRALEGTPS